MIQDIAPKKFDNSFCQKKAANGDKVIVFYERTVLLRREETDMLFLPDYSEFSNLQPEQLIYVFSIDETKYFIKRPSLCDGEEKISGYAYENLSQLRQLISKDICFAIMSAYHLFVWYQDNRYCGRCGTITQESTKERMLFCTECGNMIYPKIAPAVIIGVVSGNRLLLSKYAGREYKKYALLAGFTEFGETVEETVKREVLEEVGLHVKDLKYYKSQPWGIDSNLLLGYFAELDGDEQIDLDTTELAMAEWFERGKIPASDDGISLTREMIGFFEDGENFPKWFQQES